MPVVKIMHEAKMSYCNEHLKGNNENEPDVTKTFFYSAL